MCSHAPDCTHTHSSVKRTTHRSVARHCMRKVSLGGETRARNNIARWRDSFPGASNSLHTQGRIARRGLQSYHGGVFPSTAEKGVNRCSRNARARKRHCKGAHAMGFRRDAASANATMQAAIVRAELCALRFLQCAGMFAPQCSCLSRSVPVQWWRFAQWRDCLTPAVTARPCSTSPPVASTPAGRVADRAQCATSQMLSGTVQGRAS